MQWTLASGEAAAARRHVQISSLDLSGGAGIYAKLLRRRPPPPQPAAAHTHTLLHYAPLGDSSGAASDDEGEDNS